MLFSTAPFGSGFATIASIVLLLLIVLHARSTRSAMFWVFMTQIPLWLWLHHWVYGVAAIGWVGVGLYMSIWAPLFVGLLRKVQSRVHVSMVISAPVLWVGIECIRGIIIFDGYPWYLAGTGILDWPIASIASVGSVWLTSMLVVMIATILVTATKVRWWTWVSLGVVCIYFFIQGISISKNNGGRMDVAVVQTNVPQSNKIGWTWENQLKDVAQAINMTYKAVHGSEEQLALVVWPETMLPGSGFEVTRLDFSPWDEYFTPLWFWAEEIRKLSKELNVPILIGANTWLDIDIIEHADYFQVEQSSHFNSAVLVKPDGTSERYDKTFLTPFGERIPYVEHFPSLQEWLLEKVAVAMLFDVDAGGTPHLFTMDCKTANNAKTVMTLGTPICFEDTVPSVVRELVWKDSKRKVSALINMSNDGWFGDDDWSRLQHVREARMRCIENMTPMLRVANTGLSCSINQYGTVQAVAMENGKRAIRRPSIMFARVFEGAGLPLSRFVGDSVAWLSLIGSILLLICSYKKRSKDKDESTK